MRRQIGWILCLVAAFHALYAPPVIVAEETDRVSKLLEEAVQFENGKMTIQEFGLLSFPWAPNEKIQIGFYAEAPESGVVSRDNFVGISSMLQTVFLVGIAMEAKSATGATADLRDMDDLLEFDELDEPIGKIDLEINLYMSKGGLQMEFVNTRENRTERNTVTWKEFLE